MQVLVSGDTSFMSYWLGMPEEGASKSRTVFTSLTSAVH